MKNDKLPHYLKAIIVSDPELVAILNHNTKEDNKDSFDFKSQEFKTALTGVLIGANSFELFKKILPDLIDEKDFNISYLKECLYFSVPFLGIAKVYPFLKEVAKFVGKNEISISKKDYAAKVNSSNKDLRHRIFDTRTGFGISENDASNTFKKSIDEFVFKKFYERTLLTYKAKELLALFVVISSNASAQTLTEHVNAALKTGNKKEDLISLIESTAIFSGYIKASEAIRAVKNAKKLTVITSLDTPQDMAKDNVKSEDKNGKEVKAEQSKSKKKYKKSDEKTVAKAKGHDTAKDSDVKDTSYNKKAVKNDDDNSSDTESSEDTDKKDKSQSKQKKSHKK